MVHILSENVRRNYVEVGHSKQADTMHPTTAILIYFRWPYFFRDVLLVPRHTTMASFPRIDESRAVCFVDVDFGVWNEIKTEKIEKHT